MEYREEKREIAVRKKVRSLAQNNAVKIKAAMSEGDSCWKTIFSENKKNIGVRAHLLYRFWKRRKETGLNG